jgi:hypothetical protein
MANSALAGAAVRIIIAAHLTLPVCSYRGLFVDVLMPRTTAPNPSPNQERFFVGKTVLWVS